MTFTCLLTKLHWIGIWRLHMWIGIWTWIFKCITSLQCDMSLLMQATINRNMLHHIGVYTCERFAAAQYHTSTHKDNIHKMNNNSLAFRRPTHRQHTNYIHKIGLPYTDNRHAIYTQYTSNKHTIFQNSHTIDMKYTDNRHAIYTQ